MRERPDICNDAVVKDFRDVPRIMKLIRQTLQKDFNSNWKGFREDFKCLTEVMLREGGLTAAIAVTALEEYGVLNELFGSKDVDDYFVFLDDFGDSADVARNLLCLGFDVKGIGLHGWNAFCYAVWRRKLQCIPYLKMAGADPDHRVHCDEYDTPVEMAVAKNDVEMLLALVAVGADLSLKHPTTSKTPLELAMSSGHMECARIIQDCISR